jgi:hypothetical protein
MDLNERATGEKKRGGSGPRGLTIGCQAGEIYAGALLVRVGKKEKRKRPKKRDKKRPKKGRGR